jgi:hypothetical protein
LSSRSARALVLTLAAAAAAGTGAATAAPAEAAAPRVQAMVVGKSGWTVGPRTVAVGGVRVNSCRLRAGLPIGVLGALRQPFRARGGCSALYVSQVRGDREARGAGWVYKVGNVAPSRSASDPTGRLRSGQKVLWFWCKRSGACNRTLATRARVSGPRMRVTVTAYDDYGRGRRVAAATVIVRELGSSTRRTFRTANDGTVLVPVRRGKRYRVDSRRGGVVRGFPATVRA